MKVKAMKELVQACVDEKRKEEKRAVRVFVVILRVP